jgi:hypothetical protein
MDQVQRNSNTERNTPLLEPFTVTLHFSSIENISTVVKKNNIQSFQQQNGVFYVSLELHDESVEGGGGRWLFLSLCLLLSFI